MPRRRIRYFYYAIPYRPTDKPRQTFVTNLLQHNTAGSCLQTPIQRNLTMTWMPPTETFIDERQANEVSAAIYQ